MYELLKTEVMIVAKQDVKARVFVENRELKQTTEFKYLGSVIASNGKIQSEIENRCCKSNQILGQLTPILQNKHVTLDTKRNYSSPICALHCQTFHF
jgi:hypothetical protein